MKTYITEEQLNDIDRTLNQLISPEHIARIKQLKSKYGLDFCHDRKTNMQMFYLMVIREIDSLPMNDKWKASLSNRNLYWNNNDHSNGVTLELKPTISNYMDIKGYNSDYEYLANYSTNDLEFYLNQLSRTLKTNITISDIIKVYPDIRGYFSRFTKQHCDKDALKYTKKICEIIDKIYGGEFLTVHSVMGTYTELMQKGKPQEDIFDAIHNLIHK
ncbi:MAG: hypothetical protein IPN08_17985 [Bacteroidales bacterium]|nr:hypothetical protein [Bacteroidales bacterium]